MMEDSLWLDQFQAQQFRRAKRTKAIIEILDNESTNTSRASSCASASDLAVSQVAVCHDVERPSAEIVEVGCSSSHDASLEDYEFSRLQSLTKKPRTVFASSAQLFLRACHSGCETSPLCVKG
eukprot:CAMPEP_0196717812 /NCGR_PEP_ID=MMETSP1091-20130531/1156_1 /TAXON_ID=302021 /ORGANISM="Rhodomonas sp., Strain CCMP768" /LENGTH=122 /DNA_ID=CAMNT_0042058303 /DNA_START=48 /DNA_END=416 /DNA_ORIENTATION=-